LEKKDNKLDWTSMNFTLVLLLPKL